MAKKVRPNLFRQLILIGLAVVGLALGYGLGFVFKPEPAATTPAATTPTPTETSAAAPPASAAPPATVAGPAHPPLPPPNVVLPEDTELVANGPVRAYEEALPPEIVVTVERFGPVADNPGPAPPKPSPADPAPADPPVETAAAPTTPVAAPAPATRPQPPPWRRYAVAATPDGRPMIAIVFDDLGIDKSRTQRTIELPGPLSMSFLTYATRLDEQTRAAREAGHEIWMHMPMEPGSRSVDPGPRALLTSLDEAELTANLRWGLDRFDGYVGINNHMGSRFTADMPGMRLVMAELKSRGLAFLDSVTSSASKGRRAAAEAGIDFATRNVFIDHQDDVAVIRTQLARIEALARKQGHAIAIGHPREKTLEAITPWLQGLDERGFQLVPVSLFLKDQGQAVAAN